mmetsp:Transcript_35676/g.70600  ORF Transcript_35676/g.70600 Transcript_35676/m.70600 type:complete len:156 (-) Transcript_35676:88-555(-)
MLQLASGKAAASKELKAISRWQQMPVSGLRLDVSCRTQPGETLCVCGSDFALGNWDQSSALRLRTTPEDYPVWSANVALPAAGSEFKFFTSKPQQSVEEGEESSGPSMTWEPLGWNRTWPINGLRGGCLVEATYGESGIKVTTLGGNINSGPESS